jgi:exodeoxyribonuclease V alpha subunit
MSNPVELSALDRHFADFIMRQDDHPCPELWWSAALVSNAAAQGHSCLLLTDIPDLISQSPAEPRPSADPVHWRTALSNCRCLGTPGSLTPLLLDGDGRLYLQRNWSHEQRIVETILAKNAPPLPPDNRLESALDRYFPRLDETPDLQRSAARMALTQQFSVISGGPGTGKTATVAKILALHLELAGASPPQIMLAAPTGKAALRLHQSILLAIDRLGLPDTITAHLPVGVSTIHRLLGVHPRSGGFRHNHDNPLPGDLLVVDEASMVDLQLMAALLAAVRPTCRVILLGDRNQLSSVEAGAVLADICDGAEQASVPVTQLTRSYRFSADSGIAELSRLINNGDSDAVMALLMAGEHADVAWQHLPEKAAFDTTFSALIRREFAPCAGATTPGMALAALNRFKVLSPLRSGPVGIDTLNSLSSSALANSRKKLPQGIAPRPVMITGNNYELELFNGDSGVIMAVDGSEAAWFEKPDGSLRRLSLFRLPLNEAAYALTVHKSQGSEYDHVLLILPEQLSPLLSRELLYTAVTRARSRVTIWGSEAVIRHAVDQRTRRTSGLAARLAAGGSSHE